MMKIEPNIHDEKNGLRCSTFPVRPTSSSESFDPLLQVSRIVARDAQIEARFQSS